MTIAPSTSHVLAPTQKAEINRIKRLRVSARELRSQVSHGSYGNEELAQFWSIVESAGIVLMVSNPELGKRAGLGEGFFSSVARDRRRPKLANFLKALTTIIDVADERIGLNRAFVGHAPLERTSSNAQLTEAADLLLLATSLAELARREIEKLDAERPNSKSAVQRNKKQREVLQILASGLDRIADALAAFARDPSSSPSLSRARRIVTKVGDQIGAWCRKNGAEAVDWGMRLPVFAAGVAMLNLAGADMAFATPAVAALVGGTKIVSVLRKK